MKADVSGPSPTVCEANNGQACTRLIYPHIPPLQPSYHSSALFPATYHSDLLLSVQWVSPLFAGPNRQKMLTPNASAAAALVSSRPSVSSPLAATPAYGRPTRNAPAGRQSLSFPTSRPLRPFPSINTSVSSQNKPVKLIVPPKNFKSAFVLNLTQAELGRQD